MANKITTIFDAQTRSFQQGMKSIQKSIREADGAVNKFRAGWSGAMDEFKNNTAAKAAAAGIAVALGKQAVDAASTLEESVNAVNVTFGDAAEEVLKIGENASTSFGMSKAAFNSMAVQFSNFAEEVAGPGGDVAATIEDLSTRVADFASVMDLDLATAAQVFQSTLAGQTEPIRRYGIDVSAAAVEHYALAEGLVESKSEMTEAIKVQARYGLVMQDTEKFAGDFENTSDSLANTTRTLNAQLEDMKATIGEELIPAVSDATAQLSDMLEVAEKLKLLDLAPEFRKWDVIRNPIGAFESMKGAATSVVFSLDEFEGSAAELRAELVRLGADTEAVDAIVAKFEAGQLSAAAATDELTDAVRESGEGLSYWLELVGGFGEIDDKLDERIGRASEAFQDLTDDLEEVRDEAEQFHDELNASFGAAADAVGEFSDEAMLDLDRFKDELAWNTEAAANWQNNLIAIARATSPEFAQYLAEMGTAGYGMVDELANSSGDLNDVFGLWVKSTEVTQRDMAAEFAKFDPAVRQILWNLPANASSAWDYIRSNFFSQGLAAGRAAASGVQIGLNTVQEGSYWTDAIAPASDRNVLTHAQQQGLDIGKAIGGGGGGGGGGIAGGIDDSADKIDDAITDILDDAVEAAEDAADAISDTIDSAFDSLSSERSLEAASEAISDATVRLTDAQAKLAEAETPLDPEDFDTLDEYYDAMADQVADIEKAFERVSDAETRLRDANFRKLELLANSGALEGYYNGQPDPFIDALAFAAGVSPGQLDSILQTSATLPGARSAVGLAQAAADVHGGVSIHVHGNVYGEDAIRQAIDDAAHEAAATIKAGTR